jgi:hypothetical protein
MRVNYTERMQGLWPKLMEIQVVVDVAPSQQELRVQGIALIVRITS